MSAHPTRNGASGARKVSVTVEELDWLLQRIEEIEAHAEEVKTRATTIAGLAFHLRHQVRAMMRPEGL